MENHNRYIVDDEIKAKVRAEMRKERRRTTILLTVLIIFFIAVIFSLTQIPPVRTAIDDVPVIGVLPEIVDKIPVIGQIDEFIEKIPGVNLPEDTTPLYETGEHYAKPTMRTEEEIAQTGLTVEDVLAAYDNLAWKFSELRWAKNIENWGLELEGNVSAQFDKITVCNYSIHTTTEAYPFYGINNFFHSFKHSWFSEPLQLKDTYCINFYADAILRDQVIKTSIINAGIYKDQFEPVANSLGNGKFIFTQEMLDNLPNRDILPFLDFRGVEVYHPFEITRQTIENATQEELYLLYDMCKSLYSINVNGENPNG